MAMQIHFPCVLRFGAAPASTPTADLIPKGPPGPVPAVQAQACPRGCNIRWIAPNDGGEPITDYIIDVRVRLL